jgi:hypothetical protein
VEASVSWPLPRGGVGAVRPECAAIWNVTMAIGPSDVLRRTQ